MPLVMLAWRTQPVWADGESGPDPPQPARVASAPPQPGRVASASGTTALRIRRFMVDLRRAECPPLPIDAGAGCLSGARALLERGRSAAYDRAPCSSRSR